LKLSTGFLYEARPPPHWQETFSIRSYFASGPGLNVNLRQPRMHDQRPECRPRCAAARRHLSRYLERKHRDLALDFSLRVTHVGGYNLATMRLVSRGMEHINISEIEKLAVLAKPNMLLGRTAFDQYFLGFETLEIRGTTLIVRARVDSASAIARRYAPHLAIAVASVLRRPVKAVSITSDFNSGP
jgi:hypothetical protein